MSIAHGVKKLGVIGAGQMGLGIAFVSAVHAKVPVLLHDRSAAQIKSGLSLMDKLLAKDVAKGKLSQEAAKEARDRVTVVDELKSFRDTDMVVEAVSENLGLKQGIFRSLSAELSPKTILASNTSSISITKIAASTIPEGKTASDPEGQASASRVVGLHFFNPVPVMKLVELIAAVQTSPETLDRAHAFAKACGKGTSLVLCVKDFLRGSGSSVARAWPHHTVFGPTADGGQYHYAPLRCAEPGAAGKLTFNESGIPVGSLLSLYDA